MRTTIETIHQQAIAARPWLHWLAPVSLGAADALNSVEPSVLLYLGLLAVSVTVTTSALVGRSVARVAEKAPVNEAMLLGYQMHAEICGGQTAEQQPQAVGDDGATVALPGRRLHIVQAPGDLPAAKGKVYRGKVAAAKVAAAGSMAMAAAVPQQPVGRQNRLAAGQRLRPQP